MSNDDSDKKERRRFLMCVCVCACVRENLEKISSGRGSERNDRWALCERLTKRSQKRPSVVKSLSPLCGNLGWADERQRAVSEGNGKGSKRMKGWELRKKEHLLWSDRDQRATSTQAVSLAKKLALLATSTSKAASQPPQGGSPPATELTSRSSCVPTVPL